MNIIKETLEKTFNELNEQIRNQEEIRRTHLVNKVNYIAVNIDDLFKEFTVQVSDTNIIFKFTGDSWYGFRIERSQNYKADGYEYGPATISTSSVSDADGKNLLKLICLGKLAKHCLHNTNEWTELISLMDESNEIYKANISPLYKQIYQIEAELGKIKNEEKIKKLNALFSKGTFKLNKIIAFYYGNGKWDNIWSDEFFWEENSGGKTYTVSYMDREIKRVINKRIRKVDIESFVNSCIDLILVGAVEVAS
jgi:hypothetical protein